MQQEIRQTRPFASPRQEAFVGLLKTADVLRRAMAAVVGPHGLTGQQYNVLRILRGAGAEGLPTLEIASRMVEEAPGITRLLDRLEAKRLVLRERCPEDRRQVRCRITDSGLAVLGRLDGPVNRLDGEVLDALNHAQVTALIRSLEKVRTGCRSRDRRPQAPSRPNRRSTRSAKGDK